MSSNLPEIRATRKRRGRQNNRVIDDDESRERCVVKEYSRNRLKTEIVITKRTKIHPTTGEEPELDGELVVKCLAAASRKVLRLLCYLSVFA